MKPKKLAQYRKPGVYTKLPPNLFKVAYQWNKSPLGVVTCAWCGKEEKKIKNPKKHIEKHIKEDK